MNLTEEQVIPTCGNCSRKIYKSGGKWYHQSSGGMACSSAITALAIPDGDAAAILMRDKCVDAIKSLRAVPRGLAYNNAINDAIHKVESLSLDQVKPGEM